MCGQLIKISYEQRKPELTKLYQIISAGWKTFLSEREQEGRSVPKYIVEEFESYLRCGILAYGFGRLHCATCDTDYLVPFSCKGRGFCPSCGARRMAEAAIYLRDELVPLVPVRQFVVTFPPPLRLWLARSNKLCANICKKVVDALDKHLRKQANVSNGVTGSVVFIQRFGSAANLNVHLHIVALDGVYEQKSTGDLKFYNAAAPTAESTLALATDIAKRVNNVLLRKGYLEQRDDLTLLANTEELFSNSNDELHLPAQAASVGNRIAFGPNAGQPVRRLRLGNRPWPAEDDVEVSSTACVNVGGYSIHAATAIKAHERDRLEKLVRYMARPAIADERLSLTADNSIKLRLKNPWRDGTESILFSPSEFIEKLIALVPIPRFHLTRYYGVFANRSQFRSKLPDMPEPPPIPQLGVINEDNKQNTSDMGGNKSGKSGKRSR
ncbi:MAG: transposase, partial [Deltaproteobacteria bacterium]